LFPPLFLGVDLQLLNLTHKVQVLGEISFLPARIDFVQCNFKAIDYCFGFEEFPFEKVLFVAGEMVDGFERLEDFIYVVTFVHI